ncbi:alpha/beta hydrolase family protein [Streptomyces aureocirculatus]|uniref:alpha/beta hydrolase family protein n=1 Tax=Streptomyces aureocirculatus TaxID=67275 RepID=UPI0004C6C650|nr:alpha/beta hydrolase [Streptomyces aureocirculatus]
MTVRRALLTLTLCGTLLSAGAATPPSVAAPSLAVTEASAAAAPAPSGRVFAYGAHPRQTVTVYGPPGGKRPALVVLHGGSWARDTDWSGWSRWFAARGFTVYDTDYRLSSDAVWSAQRTDVLAALRWTARREGPGAPRPLLLGSSAGGHLAVSVGAYGEGRAYTRGVVALSPVASPLRAWRDGTRPGASCAQRGLARAAKRLAGCDPGRAGQSDPGRAGLRCRERWSDMSAASHASGARDAPLYLVHSAGDFVPPAHSAELAAAQGDAGLRDVTLRTLPGSAHGGPLLRAPGLAEDVLRWLRAR